jgi:hypothetical protein
MARTSLLGFEWAWVGARARAHDLTLIWMALVGARAHYFVGLVCTRAHIVSSVDTSVSTAIGL